MNNLNDIVEKIDKHINEKDKVREQALRYSRDIIIKCRKAIQSLHRDLIEEAENYIQQSSAKLVELNDLTKDYPDLFHSGFVPFFPLWMYVHVYEFFFSITRCYWTIGRIGVHAPQFGAGRWVGGVEAPTHPEKSTRGSVVTQSLPFCC